MEINAVIGALYGDEGKGLMVDFLARKMNEENQIPYENQLVIRYCGGPQAAHTVVMPGKKTKHVFHLLGSAALRGAHTVIGLPFFSSQFVETALSDNDVLIEPQILLRELEAVEACCSQLGVTPGAVLVALDCLMITPSDVAINWYYASKFNNKSLASCGHGVNEARQKWHDFQQLREWSLDAKPTLRSALKRPESFVAQSLNIDYVNRRLARLNAALGIKDFVSDGVKFVNDYVQKANADYVAALNELKRRFGDDVQDAFAIANKTRLFSENGKQIEIGGITLESTQGLLLDRELGLMPHVTNAEVGLRAAVDGLLLVADALDELSICFSMDQDAIELFYSVEKSQLNVYYVTRAVPTRHGSGPLPTEVLDYRVHKTSDETNVTGRYQGELRYSWLELEKLKSAVEADISRFEMENFGIDYDVSLVVTHMDMVRDADMVTAPILPAIGKSFYDADACRPFLEAVRDGTGRRVAYASYGPTADDVEIAFPELVEPGAR